MFTEQQVKDSFFSGEKLFQLYDTHGLPLEIAIENILNEGKKINWAQYILTATKAGWSKNKISNTVFYALDDVKGHEDYKKDLKIIINQILK